MLSLQQFHYTNQSTVRTLPDIDDKKDWERLRVILFMITRLELIQPEKQSAMFSVGLDDTDQDKILSIISAVLHLGNIDFNKTMDQKSFPTVTDPGCECR